MTAVDVIIRSCLLMTWDGRHGRTQTPCTQTLSHSCSHIEIFRCIISVTKTQYSVLADFLKKGFCTTICSQMTLHYFQNNLHPKIHLCYESENESVVTCVQTGKWFWKYFSPCLFFFVVVSSLQARWKSTTCNAVARSYQRKCQSTQQVMRFDIWHQSIIRPAPAADGVCSFARGSAPRGGLLRDREG